MSNSVLIAPIKIIGNNTSCTEDTYVLCCVASHPDTNESILPKPGRFENLLTGFITLQAESAMQAVEYALVRINIGDYSHEIKWENNFAPKKGMKISIIEVKKNKIAA